MRIILLLVSLLHTIILFGQQAPFQLKASKLIHTAVQENQSAGLAAGFVVNGEIKWQEGAGWSDVDNNKPFDPSTVTRIASISKTMTAVAIMQLYEQGKLDLDKPIQTYLPSFPKKSEGVITVRHLLHHTSGIAGYKNNAEQENKINYTSLTDAVSLFKDRDLISVPGEEFNYTTYGYVVLGLILEHVSGLTYEAYMKANIWEKANMTNTGVEYLNSVISNQSKIYHRNSKGKIKAVDPTNLSDRIPGGGLYSTVPDLLRFGEGLLNNTLIKESTFKLMTENSNLKQQGNGYGFGLYLYGENPIHGDVYGHNGAQTGATTFLMLLPAQKTVIAVLANTSGAMQTVTDITIKLFDVAAESKK
jgi:CubicO group peptidase (beta-lactamase class C family)